ncbi:hypothetical protein NAC44_06175 [Allorhizobium sp. BGMRC 0089]|uniref:hypothetical protein n=1 Tax=Allorhizobium sonneratiae TaxID=2934936 RepID=UPI002033BDD2|nr:hypothetical protein [Allorhizobium sonneratiae]MCM2291914.1 hypothetical protein [Allorhizobium sonneratiae]
MADYRKGWQIGVVLAAAGLASCTTTATPRLMPASSPGLLSRIGSVSASPQNSSALYINALQGGIVSRSGAKLTQDQRLRALEAEYKALEDTPGGQSVTWRDGNAAGEVSAAAPYQVGNQNCRQYTHSVTMNGKTYQARGAACRNADGTWTPLT